MLCCRCRWIHGNKCLREKDLHKCKNWLTLHSSINRDKVDLPVWILKDGGHKSFFTFLSCKEIENLTLYNVGFFFFLSLHFLNEFQRRNSKRPRAKSAEEISKHNVLFLSVAFLTNVGANVQGWHGFSSPTQSHLRLENRNVYWRNSVALFSEEA